MRVFVEQFFEAETFCFCLNEFLYFLTFWFSKLSANAYLVKHRKGNLIVGRSRLDGRSFSSFFITIGLVSL